MTQKKLGRALAKVVVSAALALAVAPVLPAVGQQNAQLGAGANKPAAAADQAKLIEVLKSDRPKAEKAIACKQLVTIGTKEAVPALAALLTDAELNSWARIALEVIPDPAADDALRDALGKAQGRQLVGVMNSIGYRRDAKAIEGLAAKLKESDGDVVASAAAALGRIGGLDAAKALEQALTSAPAALRSAVAEGAVLCAERFMVGGNGAEAVKLYDTVRKAELPKQRIIEATRGAILARGGQGIPLLVEQLRSADKAMFDIGLRAARELQGGEVTEALMAEVSKAPAERQDLILYALGDRGDAKALPAVVQALKGGPVQAKVAAAAVLETMGDPSVLPVLLDAAIGEDAEVARAARTTLARMRGKAADEALFAKMQESSGKTKQVLIELVEQRRLEGAVPLFLKYAQDGDAGVRKAALEAVGAIGTDKEAGEVVKMLQGAKGAEARGEIERALMAICARWGAAALPYVQPLAKSGENADRIVALRAVSSCGGEAALASVTAAVDDKDEAVQDEAVRTLSNWPNRWPEDAAVLEPLTALAKGGKKPSHQVLAQRGYLQFVQGTKKLNNEQRLEKVTAIWPLLTRAEEKRSAVSVLGTIRTGGALEKLVAFTEDPAVAEEAGSAIVTLLGNRQAGGIAKELRQKALQKVVETSKVEGTRNRAQEALKAIR